MTEEPNPTHSNLMAEIHAVRKDVSGYRSEDGAAHSRIDQSLARYEGHLNRIDKVLWGHNGSVGGILSDVAVIKTKVNAVVWIIGIGVAALVTGFIGVIISLNSSAGG